TTSPRAMVVAFAAIAIACGGVALFTSARTDRSAAAAERHPLPPPVASAITATPVVDTAPSQPSLAPIVRTQEPTSAKPKPVATAIAKPAAVAPVVTHEAAPPPAATQADPKANCRPPYVIDAEGHRHYKVECI